jgi:hypothetical protein
VSGVHLSARDVANLRGYLDRAGEALDRCSQLAHAGAHQDYLRAVDAHRGVLAEMAGYLAAALRAAEQQDDQVAGWMPAALAETDDTE